MKQLPETQNPLMIRTDFSNQEVWESICAAVSRPAGEMDLLANVEFLSDESYKNVDKQQLLKLFLADYEHNFFIIVDQIAVLKTGNPLLVVDLYDEPGREFRAVPEAIQSIENNLSLANMDFEEFANCLDEDGIFRDFEKVVFAFSHGIEYSNRPRFSLNATCFRLCHCLTNRAHKQAGRNFHKPACLRARLVERESLSRPFSRCRIERYGS